MDMEQLLAELERLETQAPEDATRVKEPWRRFQVTAPSPLSPESVSVVPLPADSPGNAPVFALPPMASPFGSRASLKRDLERATRPVFAMERLGPYPKTGAYVSPSPPSASRLLAQMPMSSAGTELVPTRDRLVSDPLQLSYAFHRVDTSSSGAQAGFASALTKQDEYARGRMSNKPFAPGGQGLVDEDPVGESSEATKKKLLSQDEQARNALVLGGADLDDEAILEHLLVRAPGLDGCLTVEDVRAQRQAVEESAKQQQQEKEQALDVVGVNPRSLLQPYFEVVTDDQHVAAIRSMVLDEKASNAMRQTNDDAVALDQLLHDLEDDSELNELGFYVEKEEPQEAEAETHKDEAAAPVDSPDDAAIGEPEAELEALLNAAGTSRIKNSSTKPSEWASMASVDVRNFHEKVPEMALKFEFELDTFQKECVIHLERHECVFVAAHTSAGKTVVAEYAIAMSQKHMTRTIYTSPIKALSNQKYRDFRSKFGADNVGLITGDVSINPEASCLVMTTEILRSMLYRGADVIRDIEWVIFDEIHYINDSERGVVWEEVIIMLPEHIGMVFLSATTPNHLEFSDWIGRTKKKKIHVISTFKRPVPLEHFLYAGKELFKVFDAGAGYLPGAYGAAKNKLFPPSDKPKAGTLGRAGGGGGAAGGSARNMGRTSGGDQSDWTKLITSLNEKSLLPVVVFAFSKKLCEESANKLNKIDLSSASEKSEIHLFLEASIQRLSGTDRELPQVLTMKEMLKRGIGVHHGGLLPIIKEMVEILFGRGLVKVLFSTETFAMGVNMPARTVVFNGIRKHDGKNFRDLLPGEYTQMAGRAGRRGLDSVGTVIIACWNNIPEPTSLSTMLAGKATSLSSQFRLTYNMILNLLRVEVLTVEDMMKRSFSEFHTQKALASKNIPQLIQKGKQLLTQLDHSLHEDFPHLEASGELAQIQDFYQLKKQKRDLEKKLTKWLLANHVQAAKTAIAPGRIVLVNVKGLPSDQLALVVRTNAVGSEIDNLRFNKFSFDSEAAGSSGTKSVFKTIAVLCLCPEDYEPPQPAAASQNDSRGNNLSGGARLMRSKRDFDNDMMMGGGKKKGGAASADAKELESNTTGSLLGKKYAVLDIPETCIDMVTSIQATNDAKINLKSLVSTSSKKELSNVVTFLSQLEEQSAATQMTAVPYVDIRNELKVNDLEIVTAFSDWQQMYDIISVHPCAAQSTSRSRVLSRVETLFKLKDYLYRMTRELSSDSLSLFPDFQQRLSVLKRLGYLSDDSVVQVKGRVACEINTCEEIVLTEVIFENVLANLEPEEIVAVLSALIFQEKTQSEPTLTPRLAEAKEVVTRITESLGLIQLEQHLEIDPAVFCRGSLNFGLMEVVYEWARGMPFKELCLLTDIQEGSIVRCITRLDEVCREVRNAARVIGDPRLYRKMEVASEAIKRDVVFASSLYLT